MLAQLVLSSQSAFSALSVNDVKNQLNIALSDTSQDTLLASYLAAAVVDVERRTGLDLRQTTWQLVLDQFPMWEVINWYDRFQLVPYLYPQVVSRATQRWQDISLVRGPTRSISSIAYFDAQNQAQTWTDYNAFFPSYFAGRLEPKTIWPVAYPRPDAATITFVNGFVTVPDNMLHAIRLIVGTWWNQREDIAMNPNTVGNSIGCEVDRLLSQFNCNTGVG